MTHAIAFLLGIVCCWGLQSLRWRWTMRDVADRVDLTAERRTILMHAQHRQDGGK